MAVKNHATELNVRHGEGAVCQNEIKLINEMKKDLKKNNGE